MVDIKTIVRDTNEVTNRLERTRHDDPWSPLTRSAESYRIVDIICSMLAKSETGEGA